MHAADGGDRRVLAILVGDWNGFWIIVGVMSLLEWWRRK
jgi:hypothetical protein